MAHNAAASIRKVPRVRSEMKTYTPDEIQRVLRAADKDRNGHLWYLALSGLRRGEIAGLKWSDIDLDAGTVTVARNRVQMGAKTVVENEPKTQSSRRTLPLDDGLVSVLKRASARYAQEKLALGSPHADSGYVACNEAGEPYTPGALTNMWHRLTAAAGVRQIRLHDSPEVLRWFMPGGVEIAESGPPSIVAWQVNAPNVSSRGVAPPSPGRC